MIGALKMRSNMIQMKLIAGLYLLIIKVEILGTSCVYVCSCIGRIPYSITRVRRRTPKEDRLKDRTHHLICMCLLHNPDRGHLLSILEMLKPRATTFSDKGKTPMLDRWKLRKPRNHGTCKT